MSQAGPVASIVVTAYGRTRYVREAIASAVGQDSPRSSYEVILIKNFDDKDLDSELARKDVRLVRAEGSMGEYLALASTLARGRVVCFLEDDDRFAPEKISSVLRTYRATPFLYLHNGYSCIDDGGRDLPPSRARLLHFESAPSRSLRTESGATSSGQIAGLLRREADFNLSCISVTADFLRSIRESMARTRGWFDGFLFYLALYGGGPVIADSEVLTRYRIHDSLSRADGSSEATRKALREDGAEQLASLHLARSMIGEHPLQEFLDYTIQIREIRNSILAGEVHRTALMRSSSSVLLRSIAYRYGYGAAWGALGCAALALGRRSSEALSVYRSLGRS